MRLAGFSVAAALLVRVRVPVRMRVRELVC